MGYSISNGERVTYSVGSEKVNYSIGSEKANYSIGNGIVAHEMTAIAPEPPIVPTYSISSTAQPYSFSAGGITKYTMGLEAGKTPVALGSQKAMTTKALGMGLKAPALESVQPIEEKKPINESAKINETKVNETKVNETENAAIIQPAAPVPAVVMLSIKGVVKDENETGLAGWKIDLYTADKTALANTTSSENGSYSFDNRTAGDYLVSEVLPADWVAVSPADGMANVTLKDKDVTLDFVNKIKATMAAPTETIAPAASGNETNTTAK
jgi:hypothetical protein